jgi:hypothetical protein
MKPRGLSELRDLEQGEIRSAGVEDFSAEMERLHSQIKGQLESSNEKYKNRANQHCRELQFEVGDHVLAHLRKERFPRGTYNKLKKTRRKTYFDYPVKWKGHPIEDASWENEDTIQKQGKSVEELMDRSP